MLFTPLLPSAGPTGGDGLAWPAPTISLTITSFCIAFFAIVVFCRNRVLRKPFFLSYPLRHCPVCRNACVCDSSSIEISLPPACVCRTNGVSTSETRETVVRQGIDALSQAGGRVMGRASWGCWVVRLRRENVRERDLFESLRRSSAVVVRHEGKAARMVCVGARMAVTV